MNIILLIILLIIIGIILLFVEFAIIPGITVAGIAGAISLIASIYIAFEKFGFGVGILTAIIILVACPFLINLFFKSKSSKKIQLSANINENIYQIKDINIGDFGLTVSRLAPMGKVKVNNQVVEAKSISGFINENESVQVIEINKTYVIVE